VVTVAYIWSQLETGNPDLDRFGIRGRVALQSFLAFGPDCLRQARAMMTIIHNESSGNPDNYLGDLNATGGPSIGPGQVYRATAIDLGLYPDAGQDPNDRDAYADLSGDEGLGISWAVAVFKDKLRIAKGDIPTAIRLYNGSGASANQYQAKALGFASSKGWSLT